MPNYGGGTTVGWTRNNKDWTFINNGESLYTPPSGIARDGEIIYDPVNNRYLLFYTLVISLTNCTHFGIAQSTNLLSWTWVADVAIGANVTIFGPSAYMDSSGVLHVFAVASPLGVNDPGLLASFKIYEMHPTTSWNVAGTWSTPAQLSMPVSDAGWNEVRVQDTDNRDGAGSNGIRMIINSFAPAGNIIKVLRPDSVNALGGTWDLVANLNETDQREGVFFFQNPGSGFRVFTTFGGGTPPSYQYQDYDSSWANGNGLTPCIRVPNIQMENGAPLFLTGPLASTFL